MPSDHFIGLVLMGEGFGGTDGPDLTRYVLVCGAVILGTGVLAFAFRRLVAGSLRGRARQRSLTVLDVLPLGGKHKLSVVRCYDRTFLLGLGEKEVSLVAELDPVIGENPVAPDPREPDFEHLLETAQARMNAKRSEQRDARPTLEEVVG